MKTKDKIEDKICNLENEAFEIQKQVRSLANNEDCFDGLKITALCQASNVIWNQIEMLKELR